MKVKLRVPMEGPRVSRQPGQIYDTEDPSNLMDEAEAARLVVRGLAELIEGQLPEGAEAAIRTETGLPARQSPTEKAVAVGGEKTVKVA